MPVDLTWEAPGPGDWWLVREHFPNTLSRMLSSLFPAVTIGWKHGAARFGLPIGEARWADVNGWVYYGPQVPLTADELLAREPAATATLASAPWRDEVRRWHDDERPRVVAANRALQGVELGPLDDDALARHFRAVVDNFLRWAPLHFEHTGFDIAAGLLFQAAEDVGLRAGRRRGAAGRRLAGQRRRGDAPAARRRGARPGRGPGARDLARGATGRRHGGGGGPRRLPRRLRLSPRRGPRPARAHRGRAARARRRRRPTRSGAGGQARPRDDGAPAFGVSGPDRARFEALLADARSSYALRDDDVGVCWNWPLGLVRRAGLEIGRRLADRHRVDDPRHVFEADPDEAVALLSGDDPTAVELARRWERRTAGAAADPPLRLAGGGDPPVQGPLPAAVARLAAIRDAVWQVAPPRVDAPLHGIGIGSRSAVGPARVVRHPDDLDRLVEGDVLVTVATTTAFNAVFPLLSAVVTEQGGLFSHTAILAREHRLPAVLGVPDLFAGVQDGDLIEVDAGAGAVRIVAAAG